MVQIACGPMDETSFVEEIPFVCSLFQTIGADQVTVMYGWACADEHLWEQVALSPFDLLTRIRRSIDNGIYHSTTSDLFITASDLLEARLCHESDIHITTASRSIIGLCASHWLSQNMRLVCSDQVSPSRESWREIRTVEEAASEV